MTQLKVGDKAPDFTGFIEEGKEVSLSTYAGKRLIIFFYPKDDTPGCTAEACNLRDNYSKLSKLGFELLGVSPDSLKKHKKFIDKYELPFPLLADEEKVMLKDYGVWGLKKFMGREYEGVHRSTFVVNGEGVLEGVITKVKTKDHTNQILETIGL